MSSRLVRNLLSSGMQAVALQVLGTGFFYLLSLRLAKDDFGIISWANAVTALIATILSMGLEQVVVRRIAVSRGAPWPAAAFFFHSLVSSVIAMAVLWGAVAATHSAGSYTLLLFFGVQGLIYMTGPFRQYLNAAERFTPYGIIAIISNAAKLVAAIIISHAHQLTVANVAVILICCNAAEWISLLVYLLRRTSFSIHFRFRAYFLLLREALPQYLSVLFDTGLSRMDWILLGILSTRAVTADYSFAYRGFEMARLPLLVLAPVIMPKFARMMAGRLLTGDRLASLRRFYMLECFFAIALPLALNIVWEPVILYLTHGKYGSGNALIFLLLSLCLPLHFIINLFWTLCFNAGKYRQITVITVLTSVLNLVLNLMLIPLLDGAGAAVAFLAATLAQAGLYYYLAGKTVGRFPVMPVIFMAGTAVCAFLGACYVPGGWGVQLTAAIIFYTAIAFITRQVRIKDYQMIRNLLRP